MTIQVSDLRAIGQGGPVTAELEYPNIPGLKLVIEFIGQEENEKFWGTDSGGSAREVPDDEFRDWHLRRVKSWNVKDGDEDAPLDLDVLRLIWREDGAFRTWLVKRCRHLGSFLKRTNKASALAVGADGDGAAA